MGKVNQLCELMGWNQWVYGTCKIPNLRRMYVKGLLWGILLMVAGCDGSGPVKYKDGAVPPDKAAGTYHVATGFQVQLFASEPAIADPTDMAIDEDGHIYVTEMVGYPLEMNHRGEVKLLRDTNGDGVMNKSLTFADHLMFPSGVMAWKGGILVTDAPYVVYFKDSSGNGRADVRDTLLTGFALSNPQLNVNNPIYGLDNWIYLTNWGPAGSNDYPKRFGDKGGDIIFWGDSTGPHLPHDADSKNVRFKPGAKLLQKLSARSEFNMTFNRWGDRFLNYNGNHIYESVIAARYLARNPNLSVAKTTQSISDHGNQAVVYQLRKDSAGGLVQHPQTMTSSNGITYYTGGLFPPPYNKHTSFVTESAFNVVHADKINPKGATFVASRIKSEQDFLASTDPWARPDNMYIGPDGALYVLDFYQKIIEHPEFLSKEQQAEIGELYKGQRMGRIYRITPKGTPPASWTRGLSVGKESSKELAGHLSDANSWWRATAQRLLVNRKDLSVADTLEKMVTQDTSAMGRLHALWTLQGLHALKTGIIEKALSDKVAGVRRNAIQLAEKKMNKTNGLKQSLYAMGNDKSPKVRFQLLETLGNLKSEKAWEIRKKLLLRDIDDKWVRLAALSAAEVEPNRLLKAVMDRYKEDSNSAYTMVRRLASLIGSAGERQQIVALIQSATTTGGSVTNKLKPALLAGVMMGLKGNRNSGLLLKPEEEHLINTFFNHPSKSVRKYALQLLKLEPTKNKSKKIRKGIKKVLRKARNHRLSGKRGAQMLEFLTLADPSSYVSELKALATSTEESQVQKVAINILGGIKGTDVSHYLLSNWSSIRRENRNATLKTFLTENDRVLLLLAALKEGKISKKEVKGSLRAQLLRSGNQQTRAKARALLAPSKSEGIPDRYLKAVSLVNKRRGSPTNLLTKGSAIFMANCSTCHQIRGMMGRAYGPDLASIKGWSPQQILSNILHPSSSIAKGFRLQQVTLQNGKTVTGIIKNKSSNAIQLQTGPRTKKAFNRNKIKKIVPLDISAMPGGFGKQLTPQEMADLILFLKKTSIGY